MSEIITPSGSSVPKISNCIPFSDMLLVELLDPNEAIGTLLHIPKNEMQSNKPLEHAPQAYIAAVGSKVPKELELKAGMRILLSGGAINVPNYDNCHRDRILIHFSSVKAIIEEHD